MSLISNNNCQNLSTEMLLSQYRRYSNPNLSQSIFYSRLKKSIYTTAAMACLFSGAILSVLVLVKISAIASLILAPGETAAILSLALVGCVTIYENVFKKGFESPHLGLTFGYLPLKKLAKECQKTIETYSRINALILEGDAPLDAQIKYSEEIFDASVIKMEHLMQKIQETRGKIKQAEREGATESLKREKDSLDSALRELYFTQVTDYVPFKVNAAYLHHIDLNRTEERPFDVFATFKPMSYLHAFERDLLEGSKEKGPFGSATILHSNLDREKTWSIQELMTKTYQELSEEIFSQEKPEQLNPNSVYFIS